MYIWPDIKSCCYEVWIEFKEYFDDKYLIVRWEKLYLDMNWIIIDIAIAHWIYKEDIIINPDCTYCDGKYFSFRKGDKDQMLIAVEKIF